MLLLFCHSQMIYRLIKKSYALVEYTAYDPSILLDYPLTAPLPMTVSISPKQAKNSILICAPSPKHLLHQLIMLGITHHAFLHTKLLYLDSMIDISFGKDITTDSVKSQSVYFPCSLQGDSIREDSAKTISQETKATRPLFFDMLLDIDSSEYAQEIISAHSPHAHLFLTQAARFWESHEIIYAVLAHNNLQEAIKNETEPIHASLRNTIDLIQNIPKDNKHERLDNNAFQWILSAKQSWKLSSTEFKQLHTLVGGFLQQGHNAIPKSLYTLVKTPCSTQEARNKSFSECTHILLGELH